jgi:hypothetical protein
VPKPSPLITNISARSRALLDGRWRFIADPYAVGEVETFRVEEAFGGAADIEVPGGWTSQRLEWSLHEGVAWYERIGSSCARSQPKTRHTQSESGSPVPSCPGADVSWRVLSGDMAETTSSI